ncbi:hypothetical protein E0H22_07330 [Rhodopseudomonas boonkerdii]|uniref:hypothetical protein n=1 Tax=Rhodopseudomonas boonkerdii TaxID=475937 RepID=UPI001E57EF77|nr:hypothetical protein [Rhodopseudomonas boonkerdii]UGV25516.1 hypothetical protein E0H22_07330 [Rhodopseudomonas boonkerdii]
MRRRSRLFALLLCLAPLAARAEGQLAVTDATALHALETSRFGLAQMLAPQMAAPIANDALFALPGMVPVRGALDDAFTRYLADHRNRAPGESIGIGAGHDVLLFDRALLTSPEVRFVLAGIVNRMDRAYVAPETCGEIRLIYRLTRTDAGNVPPRLPMTLNLVLHAKLPDERVTCADLAARWLAASGFMETGAALADRLMASDGPLAKIDAAQIDRIETNLQIAHRPKSEVAEFRTDYLQKVFRREASTQMFREVPMENQIDRERLLADAALGREFRDWLLAPANLRAFDRGTVLFPEKFLATTSLAATPVGFAPSALQPAFGLMVDGKGKGVFTESDVVAALAQAAKGGALENIRSPAGFARRLSDITCGGCHQIRGIGGFHFTGVDSLAAQAVQGAVPASPHFVGDQPRRRAIVISMRDGKTPDFSRGFSDRPQMRGSSELAGNSVNDGWGATCYRRDAKGRLDASFASWTCAEGLSCQPVGDDAASRIGMCFVK